MFPRSYYPGRYYPGRYYPQSNGDAPPAAAVGYLVGVLRLYSPLTGTLALTTPLTGTLRLPPDEDET